MKQELIDKLVTDFPFLKDSWEIAVEDGWYDLLYALCSEIAMVLKRDNITNFKVNQIKEKFGTLRFYTEPHFDAIDHFISTAEGMSAVTCEFCGEPGIMRKGSWLKTLCDKCYEEWRKR